MAEPTFTRTRKAMTPARRKRVIDAHHGTCAAIGCLSKGPFEIDHRIPLKLAADGAHLAKLEADDNLQPLCPKHHLAKTILDVAMIARAKRLAGETCAGETKRPIRSPPFDTRLTKRFDGSVLRRPPLEAEQP